MGHLEAFPTRQVNSRCWIENGQWLWAIGGWAFESGS
jgi:hypothetical protein